jgi:hypothetical protein
MDFALNGSEFIRSEDLLEMAQELMARHETLRWIVDYEIVFLWKMKAGKKHGRASYGTCQAASGLVGYFSGASWIITLGADTNRGRTGREIERTVFHELQHCALSSNGKPSTTGHDCEVFAADVVEYGTRDDHWQVMDAFVQASIPGFEGKAPNNWQTPPPEPPEGEQERFDPETGEALSAGVRVTARHFVGSMAGSGIESMTLSTAGRSVTVTKADAERMAGFMRGADGVTRSPGARARRESEILAHMDDGEGDDDG